MNPPSKPAQSSTQESASSPDSAGASTDPAKVQLDYDSLMGPAVVPGRPAPAPQDPEVLLLLQNLSLLDRGLQPPFRPGQEDDVRIQYHVRLVTREGVQAEIEGSATLSSVLSPDILPEAPSTFQQLIHASLIRPLLAKFQRLLNARIAGGTSALPGPSGHRLLSDS